MKFTELTEDTAPTHDDLIATTNDPAGTPGSKKVKLSSLFFALQQWVFGADAGSNDTYVVTLSPAPAAYVTGQHYRFKANTANTGACTVNFNGLGAKTIKKAAGGITTDLADNDIRAGQWVDVVYDGTNMQMQSVLGNAPAAGSHTHTSSDISDFAEAVEDEIGTKVIAGTGISVSYNDGTGETTVTNTDPGAGVAVTDEHIQDVVGALLADGDVDFTYDDAGNTVTNIVTKASKSFALSGDLSPSQVTSDQNDYNPTNLADNAILRLDTDSNSGAGRSLTGLAGGAIGRIITIINVGSNPLRLKAENASSSAANRFGFAIDLVLGSKRSAVLWYDSTSSRWRLVSTTAIALRHTVAISDETTALTTGTAKLTFRFATQVYLLQVRANLNTVSSSGAPAFDVNEAGASIFSTTLTIDASEKSSETAATPAVISDPNIADDAEMTVDIDTAGTGAKGAKLTFIGWEL